MCLVPYIRLCLPGWGKNRFFQLGYTSGTIYIKNNNNYKPSVTYTFLYNLLYVLRTGRMTHNNLTECFCESALGGIWRLQTGCSTETEKRGKGATRGVCVCVCVLAAAHTHMHNEVVKRRRTRGRRIKVFVFFKHRFLFLFLTDKIRNVTTSCFRMSSKTSTEMLG